MEKAKLTFEEQMRGQLSEAAVTPPPSVWVAIDGQLANEELSGYKKRILIYQWVAAACLVLFSLSGIYYWGTQPPDAETMALEETSQTKEIIEQLIAEKPLGSKTENSATTVVKNENAISEAPVALRNDGESQVTARTGNRNLLIADRNDEEISLNHIVLQSDGESQVAVKTISRMVLSSPNETNHNSELNGLKGKNPDYSTQMVNDKLDRIYGVATPVTTKLDESYAGLWAGVSVGGGSFDPGYSSSSGLVNDNFSASDFESQAPLNQASLTSSEQSSPEYPAGNFVSGGFNVGSQVTKRIVLSSGVHYNSFTTGDAQALAYVDNQTNNALTSSEMLEYRALGSFDANNSDVRVDEVSLNNEFQYITVPLKAGVILLDSKFNITLNTGISSNFLLNANIQSESLNSTQDNANSYENVYFNFLSSVEFGYSILEKYQLSIEPNYNQAISDFTNSNNLNRGRPKNFGVSVGVRYNF